MYEAYEYTQLSGIILEDDYDGYKARVGSCNTEQVRNKWHFKNSDMVEQDAMTNEEMKRHLMRQPIGAGIFAPGILQSYYSGVMTEEYLHCSKQQREVNHGITVVGFGTVTKHDDVHGVCDEYWIVRNSWGGSWGEKGTFKLCMDGAFTQDKPYGICRINEYGTWPTLD